MLNGRLTPAYTSADWVSDEIAATDGDGASVSLTGFTIEIELRNDCGGLELSGSTTTGEVTVSGNLFSWRFAASRMGSLVAGSYRVFLRITETATGDIEAIGDAEIHILEGGFR